MQGNAVDSTPMNAINVLLEHLCSCLAGNNEGILLTRWCYLIAACGNDSKELTQTLSKVPRTNYY